GLKKQFGLPSNSQPYDPKAWFEMSRGMLIQEYERNRLNASAALRILQISPAVPMRDRIEWMRTILRTGPSEAIQTQLGPIIARIVARENGVLTKELEQLGQAAHEALKHVDTTPTNTTPTNAVSANVASWKDPYAPETLRLQAAAAHWVYEPARAVELMKQVVHLYSSPIMRTFFPTLRSVALGEQAHYMLLANLSQANRAADVYREAIEAWPAGKRREVELQPLRQSLAWAMLAAGDEEAASNLLRELFAHLNNEQIQQQIGHGYAELCKWFMDVPVDRRPTVVATWLARALQLIPEDSDVRFIAAYAALEANQGAKAVEHLQVMEKSIRNEQSAAAFDQRVTMLLNAYPNNAELNAYWASVIARSQSAADEAAASPPMQESTQDSDRSEPPASMPAPLLW
ncbi:MAG: hypothetical protein FWC56_03775, partial [Phycisphaerae bacterium]|nr:hypothetical protein [Phycisphaerae bacterium]